MGKIIFGSSTDIRGRNGITSERNDGIAYSVVVRVLQCIVKGNAVAVYFFLKERVGKCFEFCIRIGIYPAAFQTTHSQSGNSQNQKSNERTFFRHKSILISFVYRYAESSRSHAYEEINSFQI